MAFLFEVDNPLLLSRSMHIFHVEISQLSTNEGSRGRVAVQPVRVNSRRLTLYSRELKRERCMTMHDCAITSASTCAVRWKLKPEERRVSEYVGYLELSSLMWKLFCHNCQKRIIPERERERSESSKTRDVRYLCVCGWCWCVVYNVHLKMCQNMLKSHVSCCVKW